MIRFYHAAIICICFFFLINPAAGQTTKQEKLHGSFQDASFAHFAREIESQTSFRIYYDPGAVDSLVVSLNAMGQSLPTLLDSLFKGTDLRYAFYQNRVFISQGRDIRTRLPAGFFDKGEGRKESYDVAIYEFMSGDEQEKQMAREEKIHEIGLKTKRIKSGKANIAGHIRDIDSGEPIIGAVIYHEESKSGVVSDPFGYYSISLATGKNKLKISSVGMEGTSREIMLYADGKLDIELKEKVTALKEVVVTSTKEENIAGMQMGLERLDIKTMKQVPMALGEVDIMRVVMTLPGVQSAGESSTGLNVRGGATSQNLILFNDAPIYNPSHLFGFFSAFNPDVIKSVELFKAGIPAEYGGRLSSVLEVSSREGNKKKLAGAGGIGPVTGRLTLEGPIIKDKMSFLLGGRSTYSNWLLSMIPNETIRKSKAGFYDLHSNISHEIDDKNSLYLSGYFSNDRFNLGSDTLYQYSNLNSTLKWKHIFQNKLYGVFTGGISSYQYNVSSEQNPVNAFELAYKLSQGNLKADFSYFHNDRHSFSFGASSILYKLQPGSLLPTGNESLILPDIIKQEQALESALYIGDRFELTPKLSLYFGLRYSFYQLLGPQEVVSYAEGLPKSESTMRDTISYKQGKIINSYHGPEYRFSARYLLPANTSVKVSLQRMRQYIHMLSNSMAVSPTDIWKLSSPHIRPEVGDQVSIGLYKNFRGSTIETSVEGYYKNMQDFLDYKDGARLLMNHQIETDIIHTRGTAYGVEMMVKRLGGKLNGWLSYTYSRSLLQTEGNAGPETINRGALYPSNFDKPHDFTMVSNYKFSRRFSFSFNFTYSTGRPITLPLVKYELNGASRLFYSERNQYRIPDFYRADISFNIEGNHKIQKLAHSSWSISVYNLTGRKNAYSVYFKSENGQIKGYKMSVFGSPIPTITYNFKF